MNRKIMIVDDDKEFLEELNEVLALNGYEVVVVDESNLVVDVASREKPDVILLDVRMPYKNGFEIASELRNISGMLKIPIVVVTGYFKGDFIQLMNIYNIKYFLKKPVEPLKVISTIEDILKGKNNMKRRQI